MINKCVAKNRQRQNTANAKGTNREYQPTNDCPIAASVVFGGNGCRPTRTSCESALLERLQLATDVALQAGAAMKAVINVKKEGIVLKGATDL